MVVAAPRVPSVAAAAVPVRGRKSKRAKRQEFEQMQAPVDRWRAASPAATARPSSGSASGSSLNDFADKINANPGALVTVLFHLGEMATATQSLDEDTFGCSATSSATSSRIVSPEEEERELLEAFNIDLDDRVEAEDDEDLAARPPVVTVMGHVDHGKTKLLDAIRNADVAAGEAGGITQHIGAYQVHTEHEGIDRPITFIDTPGHEAFTAMRARGAQGDRHRDPRGRGRRRRDAADHRGAQPRPGGRRADRRRGQQDRQGGRQPDKIRQQLTEYNLVAEEYGGDTMFVDVSAKQGENIDELLEAVLLTADAALDLRANPDKDARGVAIEANLDKGRGAVGDRARPVAARCTSATRSSPAPPTAASARCSTSTATRSPRRPRRARSRCSA